MPERGKVTRAAASVNKSSSTSSKTGLQFPVGRITRFLKVDKHAMRIDIQALVYLVAVLEYVAAEALESFYEKFDSNLTDNRTKPREVLQREEDLNENFQLVGKDALEDTDKIIL